MQAGSGPLESKIPANLRANFSSHYLSQEVDGRTRKEAIPSPALYIPITSLSLPTRGLHMLCWMPRLSERSNESSVPWAKLGCAVLTCFMASLQILADSTREAMRLGLTEKFLAEGQPEVGKNGHVLAAVSHRCARRALPRGACSCAVSGS